MLLENLQLNNFKNYNDCSFTFSPKLNFIFGENGNGKTNILEAISLLCYSKSFLMNAESDCVMYGENSFAVYGDFRNPLDSIQSVKMNYDKGENEKQLMWGTEKVGKLNEFIGNFPLVIMSPQDLKLTTGTPQDRRRNFDLLVSQISRVYLDDLRNYNRVIKQKNSLLKANLFNRRYTDAELKSFVEVWNEELVLYGIKILIRRLDFLEDFKKYLSDSFNKIVGKRYVPIISYESDVFGVMDREFVEKEFADIPKIRERFRQMINEKMDAEIKRGIALAGPHRDNYIFRMEKEGQLFDVRTFASQGEHKTFVVSLKLSEFGYIKSTLEHTNTGEPILLLDDVFSELDKNRIRKISELITGYNQVFITTTDQNYLDMLKSSFDDIKSFQIINGAASVAN